MSFCLKSSHLASSISVMTLAAGLAFGPLTTQKSSAQVVRGEGSSFVGNLLSNTRPTSTTDTWVTLFNRTTPPPAGTLDINYLPTSSGGGIAAFYGTGPVSNPPISFAGTDVDLVTAGRSTSTAIGSASNRTGFGLPIQVPDVAGAIALPYNPSGLNVPSTSPTTYALRLSRGTYCGILNGTITNWNDSRITADNGRALTTGLPIKVVYRSDGSGTTFRLSQHLQAVCGSTYRLGRPGLNVSWPTSSNFIGVSGGSGLISTIKANRGAIGYIDAPAQVAAGLPAPSLRNQANNFVAPTSAATAAALVGATDSDPNPRIVTVNVPNPTAATAYPIVGVTYFLFYDQYTSNTVAATLKAFEDLAQGPGNPDAYDTITTQLRYAPLPENLQAAVKAVVDTYVDTTVGR